MFYLSGTSVADDAITLTPAAASNLLQLPPLDPAWSVMRTYGGPSRWRWWAQGPKGTRSGDALSEAVARSRAQRAMEDLR